MSFADLHANCPDPTDQDVACDRCKRTFKCSPWDDFYCAAEGDHCCEACLLSPTGLTQVAHIDVEAPLDDPVFRAIGGDLR